MLAECRLGVFRSAFLYLDSYVCAGEYMNFYELFVMNSDELFVEGLALCSKIRRSVVYNLQLLI